MSPPQVHQLLSTIVPGDAISHHALSIQAILHDAGYDSKIFVETCHPSLVSVTEPAAALPRYLDESTLLLFHFSQGTPLVTLAMEGPHRLALIYHNLTPEAYFRRVHHQTWESLVHGRKQLLTLVNRATFGFADSAYNERELTELGMEKTAVLPIILDFQSFETTRSSPMVQKLFSKGRTTLLFVGRVTPNKGHIDLLKTFYYYKKLDSAARLIIVGQYLGFEPYYFKLLELMKRLRLEDVIFTGHVTHQELCTYYQLADIFLCLSKHEGFCVPLVESMLMKVPILALSSSAVDETLGGAAIVLKKADPSLFAETAFEQVHNSRLRKQIIDAQLNRLEHFRKENVAPILLNNVKRICP